MYADSVYLANIVTVIIVATVHWAMICLSEHELLGKEPGTNGRLHFNTPLCLEQKDMCSKLGSSRLGTSIPRTNKAREGLVVGGTLADFLPNWFANEVRTSSFCGKAGVLKATASQVSIDISPNGRWLASIGDECSIWIWDLETNQVAAKLKGHNKIVSALSFSPDGRMLASGSVDKTIKLWDVKTLKALTTLIKHDDEVIAVAFSPDSRTLASTSVDKTTLLWEIASCHLRAVLQDDTEIARTVVFSPDCLMVATGSSKCTAKIFSTRTGQLVTTIKAQSCIWTLSFSPDSRTLAMAGEGGNILLWDVQASKELSLINVNSVLVTSAAFSPRGDCIAIACCEGRVIVLSAESLKVRVSFLEHTKEVCSVKFSPDSSFVISGGADCTIRFWSILTSK
jgi:WD40 repeat protein